MPKSRNKRKKTRKPKATRPEKPAAPKAPEPLGVILLAAVFTGIAGAVLGGVLVAVLIVLAGLYHGDVGSRFAQLSWMIWRGSLFLGGVGFIASLSPKLIVDRIAWIWQRRPRRDD